MAIFQVNLILGYYPSVLNGSGADGIFDINHHEIMQWSSFVQ